MKHFLLTISIVCLLLIGCSKEKESEQQRESKREFNRWEFLNDHSKYDKESIIIDDNGIARIWLQTFFIQEEKQKFIQNAKESGHYKENYETIFYEYTLFLINCKTRELGVKEMSYFDASKNIVDQHVTSSLKMAPVMPGSQGEVLYEVACKERKQK
jgi:hypothetical protein